MPHYASEDFRGLKVDWELPAGISVLVGAPGSGAGDLVTRVGMRFPGSLGNTSLGVRGEARFRDLLCRVVPGAPDPVGASRNSAFDLEAADATYLLRRVLRAAEGDVVVASITRGHPAPLRRLVRTLMEEALAREVSLVLHSDSPVVLGVVTATAGLGRILVLDAAGLDPAAPRPVPITAVPGCEDLDPLDVMDLWMRGELLAERVEHGKGGT
jgi:hypothetical protein